MAPTLSLANHLLIAMPSLHDPNFKKSVIYICEDQVQGTVGLIINQPSPYTLKMVFDQIQVEALKTESNNIPLLIGGPLQPERGFVIHRPVGSWNSSLALSDDVTVTTSNDIIRAIAANAGPSDALVTLGYVAWGSDQLQQEVMDNQWLVCPCTPELLYSVPFEERWEYAGLSIGVRMNQISDSIGHA